MRSVVFNRRMLADERGLFLSLPTSLLYQFKDDITSIINLNIFGETAFTVDDPSFRIAIDGERHYFIIDDTMSQFVKEITLFAMLTENENNYICGITLEFNQITDCIDIYDAFYYRKADISKIDFSKYQFTYLYLTNVMSDKEPKGFDVDTKQGDIGFIIDDYTNVVMGVLSEDDVCFSRYNQFYLHSDDKRLLDVKQKYGLENVLKIVGNFYFRNNSFEEITQENISNELGSVMAMQNEIGQLRLLQGSVNDVALKVRLFENCEDVVSLQNEKRNKDIFIKNKWDEIEQFQNNVAEFKKDKTTNILKNYLNNHEYKYNTSVCLLIKDENDFLEEWLDNYWDIGVEHFYIYDNKSKVPVVETISKIKNGFYVDKCDVILFTEYKHMQYDCYENCLINYGQESRWIGFLDTDEFVEFTNETTDIKEFLKEFESDLAVWIPWDTYGANGHVERPIGGMRENYTKSVINPYGLWGKIFVQTALIQRMYVHGADSVGYYYPIITQEHGLLYEEYGKLFNRMNNSDNIYPRVKINHYMTRSYQDWVEKMSRGTSDPVFKRKFDTFFGYNPDMVYLKNDMSVVEKLQLEQGYY